MKRSNRSREGKKIDHSHLYIYVSNTCLSINILFLSEITSLLSRDFGSLLSLETVHYRLQEAGRRHLLFKSVSSAALAR